MKCEEFADAWGHSRRTELIGIGVCDLVPLSVRGELWHALCSSVRSKLVVVWSGCAKVNIETCLGALYGLEEG